MARMKLDMTGMPTDGELNRMFDAVPALERYQVGDKTVRAGSSPVVKRARQLAPRATQKDRDKRARKQKSEANWNIPLHKTIARVVRKYRQARAFAVIGPKHPEGNKAHFNTSPSGRRQVLWGRRTGKVVAQIRNWIVQAFDETKPQQLNAMKSKLQSLMDQVWKGR